MFLFLFFSKFWFSGSLGAGKKGQKWPKRTKNSVFLIPYLRNRTYDCDFWYTYVNWWFLVHMCKVVMCCNGYHYCTISFNKTWTQVLHRFRSCSWHLRDSWWWGSLTVVPALNKAKRLWLVNHITVRIHHHHHDISSKFFHFSKFWFQGFYWG